MKLGRRRVSCRYFPAVIPLNSSVGKEKFRPVDILPKGYRGVSFKDWLELIVKASAPLCVVDDNSCLG
jgi:hypothetical protein